MIPSGTQLFVATPCYGGMVHQRYMQSIIELLQQAPASGVAVQVEMLGYESLITRGRNTLVAKFLGAPPASHLLFIDSDIAFRPEQVLRMLAFNQDVVGGLYPLKSVEWDAAAIARAEAGEPLDSAGLRYVGVACTPPELQFVDGFETALFAGTGFLLIRRAVFERMIQAFPETRYTADHTHKDSSSGLDRYALFDTMIDPDTGHYLSEDYAFCRRWRSIGGTIWLDTKGELTHIGTYEFEGRPALRR